MHTESVATFSPQDQHHWQGVTLTDAAARQIALLVQQESAAKGLQLALKQSGCAGFTYTLTLLPQPAPDDLVFERNGAKLYVPLQAMPFIDGTEVDFARDGLNQLFKFNNPNVQRACGCGESFGV